MSTNTTTLTWPINLFYAFNVLSNDLRSSSNLKEFSKKFEEKVWKDLKEEINFVVNAVIKSALFSDPTKKSLMNVILKEY